MPKLKVRHALVAVLLLVAMLSQGTWALAGTTGGISGYVRDTDGVAVADALVTANSPSERTSTTTDNSGHFVFLALAPDTYTISVTKSGYQDTSLAGTSVFADQVQTLAITLPKALKTIVSTRSQAANNLVKSGVGGDIYNVDPATMQKTAALGGGGNLDSAYSAIASVPGLVVGTGGTGWNQAVVVRGNNPWSTGFEYDGIPVNRAFDNYTASTASNLGLQELQVYTGGGPASISSSGISGFINQVIKTGTYPGYGTLSGGIATGAFYHSARAEAGGASPDRNFSYYVGLSGYNQDFRYIDQSNGASLLTPGQPFAGYLYNFSGNAGASLPGGGINPVCNADGTSPTAFDQQGNALAPNCMLPLFGLFGSYSNIADREDVANFHFGIPRKNGQKDDLQVLLSNSAETTWVYSALNEDPSTANSITLTEYGQPYCAPGSAGYAPAFTFAGTCTAPTYTDAYEYNLPFGTNIAPGGNPIMPTLYQQPSSPNHAAFAPLPPNGRDSFHNDTGVVKLQWSHPFSSRSFFRVFGYTFFSDWTQAGANSGSFFEYPYSGVSPNYDLITHTAGGSFDYFNQLSDNNLLQISLNDVRANVTRFNNTGFLGYGEPIGLVSQANGVYTCYDQRATLPNPLGPPNPPIPNPNYMDPIPCYSANSHLPGGSYRIGTGGYAAGLPPIKGTAAANGAQWINLQNYNASGTFNTVNPDFQSASIEDQWRPSDKLNIDVSLRGDRFVYNQPNANTGQNPFYAQIIENYSCYNPATQSEYTYPLAPGQPAPAPAALTNADCSTLPNGAGYVHPNGTVQDGIQAPLWSLNYNKAYTLGTIEPRISATYTQNADTVWRFSAGKYAEPPISASVNYLYAGGSGVNLWGSFMDLGFLSPFHPIPIETSNQFDFSLEHRFHNSPFSIKVSPFWQTSKNWQQQSFIGAGFVTQIPVGQTRNYGVEAALNYGDFNRNGLSGLLSFTYTQSQVQFQKILGPNQMSLVQTAINNYNALANGPKCYDSSAQDANGLNVADPNCSDPANDILNPYFGKTASLSDFSLDGWYPQGLYALQPGVNTGPVFYNSPYVTNLVLNYRHDKFAITPSFQLQAGAPYGGPLDFIGQDPRICAYNQGSAKSGPITGLSPSTNPEACDYRTVVGAAGGAPQFGYLYIPDPQTGSFTKYGGFNEPNIAMMNLQLSYDVSPKVTLQLTAANLWHTCFGGTKGPWTTAYPPSSTVCGYYPNGLYVSNYYNGTGPTDTAANGTTIPAFELQSYAPKANNTIGGFFPFQLYLQAQIKL